jgi:DNA-binding GntR family transcriptional regulator
MKKSLREKIYKKIRDDITYGKLSPGERLTEVDLVREFKASRSPIREALRQLESEALITFVRNKGITVSKLSIKEVDEIYSLRSILESYAARLTAEKATKDHVRYLRDLHENLVKAAKNLDFMDCLHNNDLFHNFITDHSGNTNLVQILSILRRRVYRYKYISIRIPGHFESYLEQHAGVLKGCEKNDGEMAAKHMRTHIEKVRRVLGDHLKHYAP